MSKLNHNPEVPLEYRRDSMNISDPEESEQHIFAYAEGKLGTQVEISYDFITRLLRFLTSEEGRQEVQEYAPALHVRLQSVPDLSTLSGDPTAQLLIAAMSLDQRERMGLIKGLIDSLNPAAYDEELKRDGEDRIPVWHTNLLVHRLWNHQTDFNRTMPWRIVREGLNLPPSTI